MCIAILNTKGTTLKKEVLRNCWENNGDGAGMLYIDNDKKLSVFKEMKSFNNFYENYLDIKSKYGKRNIVLHFRISTHGKVNETNCHPFLVDDSLGFVHNGMIYDVPTSNDYSDTYMFNQEVLQSLKKGFEYNKTMLDMIEFFIGKGSKLILLNDNDDWVIVNEVAGHWHLGCWFSNTSYKQVNSWVDYGGVRKEKVGYGNYVPTSYNYWNDYYVPGTYGTVSMDLPKPSIIDYSTKKEVSGANACEVVGCGANLYGEKELKYGVCNSCIEEIEAEELMMSATDDEFDAIADYGVGDCEYCGGRSVGIFRDSFNSWVCKDCYRSLGA